MLVVHTRGEFLRGRPEEPKDSYSSHR